MVMINDQKSEILEGLARKLRVSGPLSAREMQKFTGLSQPQLSRYLKLLGDQILKIGQGRNVHYVHVKEIPQVGFEIPIFVVTKKGKLERSGILYPIWPKGFYWKSDNLKQSRIFDDLPYFLNDMRPSGFLGRLIPRIYSDWNFPEDIRFWNVESTLRYLSHFGIDSIGDLIIGETSAQKFLQLSIQGKIETSEEGEVERYEELVRNVEMNGIAGSSAGGEHPKFLTTRPRDGVSVLVKFVPNSKNEVTQRRIDLLRAENVAAELLANLGQAASTRIVDGPNYTFLEVVRFDRVGRLGRKGVISLFSLDAEFLGSGESWGVVAQKLSKLKILDNSIVEEIQFREYFGHLIGNTDMHSGNLSFYFENEKVLGLAPHLRYAPNEVCSDPGKNFFRIHNASRSTTI